MFSLSRFALVLVRVLKLTLIFFLIYSGQINIFSFAFIIILKVFDLN